MNNINSHKANSNEQNKTQKNVLDLNSNLRLEHNYWYMGKVISQKSVKLNTIHNVLKLAWARCGPVNISEVSTGVLTFHFDNEEGMCKILDMSPWVINGHALSIKRWAPSIGMKMCILIR